MSNKLMAASLVALSAFTGNAQAQTDLKSEKPLRFFLGAGVTFGGDKLAFLEFQGGDTSNIRAGGVVQFHGGAIYKFNDQIAGSVAVGYHVDSVNAKNGSITFGRYPVEVLGHYALTPAVRLGGGMRLVNSAKLSSSGDIPGIKGTNVDFGSTTGVVLQGEYLMSEKLGVTLRYVGEKYKINDKFNGVQNKVDGSHVGVMLNFYF
jgi:Outer membrane protein beta-barrel domain